ncbi:MAG: hypothetical protein B7Z37_13130 [Verrucomicrobia bacterium 12-59-8]|nr:MAG: hypothetical protein B7Z37_13130 [Verrucomicrobia bacterium 12-59-8]
MIGYAYADQEFCFFRAAKVSPSIQHDHPEYMTANHHHGEHAAKGQAFGVVAAANRKSDF